MLLDTLNNGDSGLEARTKINAAIATINAAPFKSQAWIEPVTGSDVTGVLEDSGKPFATIQAAYDAGATIFHIGKGGAGDLVISQSNANIQLVGLGSEVSSVGNITAEPTAPSTYYIRGNGTAAIKIAGIAIVPPATPEYGSAFSGGTLYIKGFTSSGDISLYSSNGGKGHDGASAEMGSSPDSGASGQPGATGGQIYAEDVIGNVCGTYPGGGGNGGRGGDSTDSTANGGGGGSAGPGGSGGGIDMVRCKFGDARAPYGGSGYPGEGGSGISPGDGGSSSYDGSSGSLSSRWCDIGASPTYGETTNFRFSAVADTWNA